MTDLYRLLTADGWLLVQQLIVSVINELNCASVQPCVYSTASRPHAIANTAAVSTDNSPPHAPLQPPPRVCLIDPWSKVQLFVLIILPRDAPVLSAINTVTSCPFVCLSRIRSDTFNWSRLKISSTFVNDLIPCHHSFSCYTTTQSLSTEALRDDGTKFVIFNRTRKLCYHKDDRAIRYALYNMGAVKNPTTEPNMKWIEWAVAEIWPFEIIQDGGLPPTWIWYIPGAAARCTWLLADEDDEDTHRAVKSRYLTPRTV